MGFVRNNWYAVARVDEVEPERLLARRVLDEPLVLFRENDGTIAILEDTCPHRFAPLSLGRLRDGAVECGYHGLRFSGTGSCVFNPRADGSIQPGLAVRAYPSVELHGLIFVWMGDPANADPSKLPDLSFLDGASSNDVLTGYLRTEANYELIIDNLLDASHADFLHPGLLSTGGAYGRHVPKVDYAGDEVCETFMLENLPTQPAVTPYLSEPGKPAHQKMVFRWVGPSFVYISGDIWQDSDPSRVLISRSLHALTPESNGATHYWFKIRRNYDLERPVPDREAGVLYAFGQEDKPMLEAVAKRMGGKNFWDLRPAVLQGDNAQVIARRHLRKMVNAEQPQS
ncbi:aromatic ring-hydroxylating dioxygenase subunit alpha [Sphingobium sp. DC-2]|uniref:aromatic ring-hydroxylating dioxygenase subunit alpha n=1 Tax=Sphingobium sp. DC-2 TaxID=1303256 RepID=UPI00056CB49D|nr:aromatic ring-hydroxylating dioxygenase subunit alpha [Sphingobium sp. DC-2]